MKVLETKRSFEQCSEIGWRGYDLCLDEPITGDFVRYLSARGNLLFLEDLKTPFFKITTESTIMKGVCGATRFRVGVLSDDDAPFLAELGQFVGRFPGSPA